MYVCVGAQRTVVLRNGHQSSYTKIDEKYHQKLPNQLKKYTLKNVKLITLLILFQFWPMVATTVHRDAHRHREFRDPARSSLQSPYRDVCENWGDIDWRLLSRSDGVGPCSAERWNQKPTNGCHRLKSPSFFFRGTLRLCGRCVVLEANLMTVLCRVCKFPVNH